MCCIWPFNCKKKSAVVVPIQQPNNYNIPNPLNVRTLLILCYLLQSFGVPVQPLNQIVPPPLIIHESLPNPNIHISELELDAEHS